MDYPAMATTGLTMVVSLATVDLIETQYLVY